MAFIVIHYISIAVSILKIIFSLFLLAYLKE